MCDMVCSAQQDVGLQQALAREADCQAHSYAAADLHEGIKVRGMCGGV